MKAMAISHTVTHLALTFVIVGIVTIGGLSLRPSAVAHAAGWLAHPARTAPTIAPGPAAPGPAPAPAAPAISPAAVTSSITSTTSFPWVLIGALVLGVAVLYLISTQMRARQHSSRD